MLRNIFKKYSVIGLKKIFPSSFKYAIQSQNRILFNNISIKNFSTSENNQTQTEKEENIQKETKTKPTEETTEETTEEKTETTSTSDEEENYDLITKEKLKEIKLKYNEQSAKFTMTHVKFEELRRAYIQIKEEGDRLKVRQVKEINNSRDFAITKMVKEILDVCDNFVRANDSIKEIEFDKLANEEKNKNYRDYYEGNTMNFDKLQRTLAKLEITELHAHGEVYDMNKHDAVEHYEDHAKVFLFLNH